MNQKYYVNNAIIINRKQPLINLNFVEIVIAIYVPYVDQIIIKSIK